MVASYVLDPGRRSHALDQLALEFLDRKMTSFEELCGKGKGRDSVRRGAGRVRARLLLRGRRHDAGSLRERFEPQLDELQLARLFHDIEMPLVEVLAEMEWQGITIDVDWFASLKERFERERQRVEQEIYATAGEEFNINSNPKLREILFEKLQSAGAQEDARPAPRPTRASCSSSPTTGTGFPCCCMEYREIAKLESTYIDALPLLRASDDAARAHVVQPDGRRDRPAVVERSEPAEHPDSP